MAETLVGAAEPPQDDPFARIGRDIVAGSQFVPDDADLDSLALMQLVVVAEERFNPNGDTHHSINDATEEDIATLKVRLDQGHTIATVLLGHVVTIQPQAVKGIGVQSH